MNRAPESHLEVAARDFYPSTRVALLKRGIRLVGIQHEPSTGEKLYMLDDNGRMIIRRFRSVLDIANPFRVGQTLLISRDSGSLKRGTAVLVVGRHETPDVGLLYAVRPVDRLGAPRGSRAAVDRWSLCSIGGVS